MSDWNSDFSDFDDEIESSCSCSSITSICSRGSTSHATVNADPIKDHVSATSEWDELFEKVARTHGAQAMPRKLIRMRAKRLAEELLLAWHGSSTDKSEAAHRFLLAVSGEGALHEYSCVILRGLLQVKGHLLELVG
jgi:hypothetical protein